LQCVPEFGTSRFGRGLLPTIVLSFSPLRASELVPPWDARFHIAILAVPPRVREGRSIPRLGYWRPTTRWKRPGQPGVEFSAILGLAGPALQLCPLGSDLAVAHIPESHSKMAGTSAPAIAQLRRRSAVEALLVWSRRNGTGSRRVSVRPQSSRPQKERHNFIQKVRRLRLSGPCAAPFSPGSNESSMEGTMWGCCPTTRWSRPGQPGVTKCAILTLAGRAAHLEAVRRASSGSPARGMNAVNLSSR